MMSAYFPLKSMERHCLQRMHCSFCLLSLLAVLFEENIEDLGWILRKMIRRIKVSKKKKKKKGPQFHSAIGQREQKYAQINMLIGII